MKRLKVFMHLDSHDRIDCICLRSHKNCHKYCLKDIVLYDEYADLNECFKNKGNRMRL